MLWPNLRASGSGVTESERDQENTQMLTYLVMVVVAYLAYRLGNTLWNKSVGSTWYIVPAVIAYSLALWLVLAAGVATRGLALMFALAVWAGLYIGRRYGRPAQPRTREIADEGGGPDAK